ncbi:MAG TPA: hypothetical protein PKE62_05540 [Anaerolineales bacterium]|nr:hypothetical protein [Anaerolineales bacterium]
MNNLTRKTPPLFFTFLIVLSLACSDITISVENTPPTPETSAKTRQIGFDLSGQIPSSPKGDSSARRHLFLHEYAMPSDGFINGIIYLNDSDKAIEQFDLLILRPNNNGWKVIYRMNVSDDSPPVQTGTTVVKLSAPITVQKNDIFAHWQDTPNGAIPLNTDDASVDGFSVGQYGFQSSQVEVGQQIDINGFLGERDYFIDLMFSTNQ